MTQLKRYIVPLMLLGALAVGCGDDDDNGMTGPTIADLAGTWQMTSGSLGAIDLTFAVDDVTLDIDETGAFILTVTPFAGPATVITGDFEITGNNRANISTDDDPDNPIPATFNLAGNTLRVQAADVELLDITGDGMVTAADEADLDITLER